MSMDIAEFARGIRFFSLQPDQPDRKPGEDPFAGFRDRDGGPLEYRNTVFPEDDPELKAMLSRLESVPRMSTLAVAGLIHRGVAGLAAGQLFVNVGVWHGYSFLAALLGNPDKRCIGVDNFSEFGGPRDEFLTRFQAVRTPAHDFFEMDYRDYFAEVHRGSLGFYFYDGEHSYENQLMGLQVAEPHFAEDCLVLVDDTNWEDPRRATYDFIANSPHAYEILIDVTTCNTPHPTWWNGIILFRRGSRPQSDSRATSPPQTA